jgi:hypothetical protein
MTQRRIQLATLRDVRTELASLYRKVDSGKIDSRDGSRRAFILKTLSEVILNGEIEPKLREIEATLAGK